MLVSEAEKCMIPIVRSVLDYKAYKISPDDHNRLAIVFSPDLANTLTFCIEIFEPGAKTPSHRHYNAVEMFFILKGQGAAICDGKEVTLRAGDSILVPPTGIHEIRNSNEGRLYALCMMLPNEDFAELIKSGVPVELDEEDLAVLRHQK